MVWVSWRYRHPEEGKSLAMRSERFESGRAFGSAGSIEVTWAAMGVEMPMWRPVGQSTSMELDASFTIEGCRWAYRLMSAEEGTLAWRYVRGVSLSFKA